MPGPEDVIVNRTEAASSFLDTLALVPRLYHFKAFKEINQHLLPIPTPGGC